MKTYTIFAGVNGAGKTSMYKSIYIDKEDILPNLFRKLGIYIKVKKYIKVQSQ